MFWIVLYGASALAATAVLPFTPPEATTVRMRVPRKPPTGVRRGVQSAPNERPDCDGPKIWPWRESRANGTPAAAGVAAVVCGVRVTVPILGLAICSVLTPIPFSFYQ